MIRTLLFLCLGFIISCSPQVVHVASISPDYYRIDKKQEANDNEIEELIKPYKDQLDDTMNKVIGTVEKAMWKEKPNSPLNNWIADAILHQANENYGKVDFAVQNYGGIRVPEIAAGELTVGKIYELMPFDNMVSIITADAKIVQMLLDRIADYGGWPISKNTSFTIADGKAVNITINGKPFNINEKYTFALPDYIANGGDNSYFLEQGERTDLKLLIRDALINFVTSQDGKIQFNDEKRIYIQ